VRLPVRPDLAQLRRQAKELHRAAAAGESEGVRRLRAVSTRTTLSAAQLAVAREHGFDSWPRLRAAVEEPRTAAAGPLMADKHEKAAVYRAADFLASAHDQGWRAGTTPAGVIFTSQTFITAHLAGLPNRYEPSETLTPTNGRVFITVAAPPIAIACLGVGAPALVTVMEHLVGLGIRSFIAVGPAPAVALDLHRGDCVVIDRALRDDGVSSHYLAPARYSEADRALTADLIAACEAAGLCPRQGSSWTVPTPFRTTADELEAYREEGVLVTEMATAALFAVAEALQVRAASAVVATRTLGVAAPARPHERHGGEVLTLIDTAVSVLQHQEAAA
jgi:uridine phosphorylase